MQRRADLLSRSTALRMLPTPPKNLTLRRGGEVGEQLKAGEHTATSASTPMSSMEVAEVQAYS